MPTFSGLITRPHRSTRAGAPSHSRSTSSSAATAGTNPANTNPAGTNRSLSRRAWVLRCVCALSLSGLVGVAGISGAMSAAAADDDGAGGIGISITVPTSTPTPAVTPTTTTTVSGTASAGTSTITSTTSAATTSVDSPTESVAASDKTSLGGVVFLSGLTSTYDASLNPLAGGLTVRFTVRNISDESFDSTAKFWITNPLGATLSTSTEDVVGLAPGESRVVHATLPGVGQWTILTAHMTFTPPSEIDGVSLVPVSRDVVVFAEPWLVFTGLLTAAGTFGITYLLRMSRAARLPGIAA